MNSPRAMFRLILFVLALIGPAISPSINAQSSTAYFGPTGTHSSAVDSKGVRHRDDERRGTLPVWMQDRIKVFAPDYPYRDRAQRNEGTGLFRLTLDLKTGAVTGITMLKSTGFVTLDRSTIAAFHHWRWKPGKWKEIEMPITFTMGQRPVRLPPGVVPIPSLGQ